MTATAAKRAIERNAERNIEPVFLEFDDNSVQAFNLTSGKALTVTETPPNTVVIGAAGTAGDSLSFAYAALSI